jgi:hypothetical protein
LVKQILVGTLLFLAAAAAVHPFGAVKRDVSNRALLAGASVDSETAAVLLRSCGSCHSQLTVWPWYSYVAPVSWAIERDVSNARAHMNLSHWDGYTNQERDRYLGAIAAAVRNNQMPPARFTFLHPESRLSPAERERIYLWARGERRRLKKPLEDTSSTTNVRAHDGQIAVFW